MEKSFIRKHTKRQNFTQIDNDLLNNYGDILYAKDKAILVYLLSKPDNWKVHVNDLRNRFKDGRDALYSGLQNLVKTGFISRERRFRADATFSSFEYHIFDDPRQNYIIDYKLGEEQNQHLLERYQINRAESLISPLPENPDTEESLQNSHSSPLPENPYTEKPDTEKPDTEKAHISNTDSSNTYSYYEEYPNFISFINAYPITKRLYLNQCFEVWLNQRLEHDENVLHYIMQTEAYSRIQVVNKTPEKFIKSMLNFLKEKKYELDWIIIDKANKANNKKSDIGENENDSNQQYMPKNAGNFAESEEDRTLRLLLEQMQQQSAI